MTSRQRLDALKTSLGRHIGVPVEITIRSESAFTFSTETVTPDLEDRIRAFFGSALTLQTEHDNECGIFCYAEQT